MQIIVNKLVLCYCLVSHDLKHFKECQQKLQTVFPLCSLEKKLMTAASMSAYGSIFQLSCFEYCAYKINDVQLHNKMLT